MNKYKSLNQSVYNNIFRCKHKETDDKEVYKKLMSFGIWRKHKIKKCKVCDHIIDEPLNVFKYDRRDKKEHKLNIIKEEWQK